jgi:hypothetical protein
VGDVDFLEVKLLMAVVVVSMLVSCEWVTELEFDRYLGLLVLLVLRRVLEFGIHESL